MQILKNISAFDEPIQKNGLSFAVLFWMVWALLPLPLVWLAFYGFHAFWVAVVLYGGVVCSLPVVILYGRNVKAFTCLFPFACSRLLVFEVLALIGLSWIAMGAGWFFLKASLLDWPHWPAATVGIGLRLDVLFWLLLGYFVILNPIVEECFWRGVIYKRLKEVFSVWGAVCISALLFGGWHWVIIQYFFQSVWQLPLTLMVCVGGILFAYLFEKTRSLLPGIIVHGLGADLAIMAILWDALHTFI